MTPRWPILALLTVLSALAFGLSACSGPTTADLEEIELDLARLAESNQRAQILAALEPLDPLRYHHLDSVVRDEARIPSDAVIWATRAREALRWVQWPPELRGHVDQYAEWLDSLLSAFRADDPEAAAEPSRIVHALAHTVEATLEAWLSNDSLPSVPDLAGLEPPSHDSHDSHDSHGAMSDDQMQDDASHDDGHE